ncbi:hypothetical protein XANMN_13240 [Xanthomonas phaseoli pv. manihotis str. CIO151]|nr:hypothetical protein XANMN_13240 [Xanthomonas phaseoli pv. manihotis str. CIO151]
MGTSPQLTRVESRPSARVDVHTRRDRQAAGSCCAREGLINSPQMRDTIALCRGFIHAADVR